MVMNRRVMTRSCYVTNILRRIGCFASGGKEAFSMAKKVNGVVRVGLIGSGGISAAHAKGFLKYKDKIQCVALCDVSDDNLKKRSEQLKDVGGGGRQFKDWKVMLKEIGSEIDAVDICLPHHLHAPAILDAAAAGKHVICE